MILNSTTSKNEDRFHAILPIWNKHHYHIKDENTVSNWNITNMVSVRLKLYEIMENDGLWDKARLLYACSQFFDLKPILPSFATHYREDYLKLEEIDDLDTKYEKYKYLKHNIINYYKKKFGSIFTPNLIGIQLNQQGDGDSIDYYLSIKAKKYYIYKYKEIDRLFISKQLLKYIDDLKYILIPFFDHIPEFQHDLPIQHCFSGIYIIGDFYINKWILDTRLFELYFFEDTPACPDGDDYIFNIY